MKKSSASAAIVNAQGNKYEEGTKKANKQAASSQKALEKSRKRRGYSFSMVDSFVPPIVEEPIRMLERPEALDTEGVFRQSGNVATAKALKKKYDAGKKVDLSKLDTHTVAGVLSLFFRTMDNPLLTCELYDCFPAEDHEILTSEGFFSLAQVEKRMHVAPDGSVVDARGLAVAGYCERTGCLVYETPLHLVTKPVSSTLVELSSREWADAAAGVSVVTTPGHDLYLRPDGDDGFSRVRAASVASGAIGRDSVDLMCSAPSGLRTNGDAFAPSDHSIGDEFAPSDHSHGDAFGYAKLAKTLGLDVRTTRRAMGLYVSEWLCKGAQTGVLVADEDALRQCGLRRGEGYRVREDGRAVVVDEVWRRVLLDPAEGLPSALLELDARDAAGVVQNLGAVVEVPGERLRDDLVRLGMHAGGSVDCQADDARRGWWRVRFGVAAAACVRVSGDVVATHRDQAARTWCFHMPSGFVVVRRVRHGAVSRPVITANCWIAAMNVPSAEARVERVRQCFSLLPPGNLAVAQRLFTYLHELAQHSEANKMNIKNIAIVFGPSLLRPADDGGDIAAIFRDSGVINQLVELCLELYDVVFRDLESLREQKFGDRDILSLNNKEKSDFISAMRRGTLRLAAAVFTEEMNQGADDASDSDSASDDESESEDSESPLSPRPDDRPPAASPVAPALADLMGAPQQRRSSSVRVKTPSRMPGSPRPGALQPAPAPSPRRSFGGSQSVRVASPRTLAPSSEDPGPPPALPPRDSPVPAIRHSSPSKPRPPPTDSPVLSRSTPATLDAAGPPPPLPPRDPNASPSPKPSSSSSPADLQPKRSVSTRRQRTMSYMPTPEERAVMEAIIDGTVEPKQIVAFYHQLVKQPGESRTRQRTIEWLRKQIDILGIDL